MHIVTISWPDDPDRGPETYGPFENLAAQDKWVADCQKAADRGWDMLKGAHYLITTLAWPFDPNALAKPKYHISPSEQTGFKRLGRPPGTIHHDQVTGEVRDVTP